MFAHEGKDVDENVTEMADAGAAYALYQKTTVSAGIMLAPEGFQAFWHGLGPDARAFWLTQFHKGTTNLSKEVVESLEGMLDELESGGREPETDSQLSRNLRQRVASRNMPG